MSEETSETHGSAADRVNPENIVWIFGTGRGGSTWLMRVMAEMPRTSFWNEPKVGSLFGDFYYDAQVGERNARNFILGDPAREGWVPLIREFVLGSIGYRRPRFGPRSYLVIKEPNASVGAPLIMEALPESRMILLVRDPRDVAASFLDAMRKGSWLYERRDIGREAGESLSDTDPNTAIKLSASEYLRNVSNARQAYESHGGRKTFVSYEELLEDTLGTMKRLYSELNIPVGEGELARVVEQHSWKNIPEGERGQGKKFRSATPGGWREDLTPEQTRIVEEITAPLLKEFYPEGQN